MTELKDETNDEVWKKFLRKYWKLSLIVVVGIIIAAIGFFSTLIWFKQYAQDTGLVPVALTSWTVGYIVTFVLNSILWEFLIIGIPVIAAAVVILVFWWNRLPEDEKKEYQREPKKRRRGRSAGGGGGLIGFFSQLIWLIIVFRDGMWGVAFSDSRWNLNYLIDSYLLAFVWVLIIGGIPATIGVIWWLRRELK